CPCLTRQSTDAPVADTKAHDDRRGAALSPGVVSIGARPMPVMFERDAGEWELRLRVPPSVDHLRTVRLVAADAGERAGFDHDEICDLRIAVSELCDAVMRSTEAPIKLGFAIGPRCIEACGSAKRRGVAPA